MVFYFPDFFKSEQVNNSKIENTIFSLLDERAEGSSICPSEVARKLSSESWRDLMPRVHQVALKLSDEEKITITQRHRKADLRKVKGPYRILKSPAF